MADKNAVLTGDLVRSSALGSGELERARSCLQAAAEQLAASAWGRAAVHGAAIDWFRGDSWQWLLRDPRKALRAAVFLRASLLVQVGCDTRVAIGIGPTTRVEPERLSRSEGEAFKLSGQALDAMPVAFRMAMVTGDNDNPDQCWLDLLAKLCDSVMVQWQGRQIELARIAALHPDYTHEKIAGAVRPTISQQAVSKSLKAAGWAGMVAAIEMLETREWLA